METKPNRSVIIIGGGLAGLTAADQILKACPDARVTVLEAMAEVGGRTRSIQINGAIFDIGAQWIGPPQKYVSELAKRAKCQTIQQHNNGVRFLQLGTQCQTYISDAPEQFGVIPLFHLRMTREKLNRMAKTVPMDNPRLCPNAMEWDSMTFHSWCEQNVWFQNIRRVLETTVRTNFGCETNQISFLFFLWYVHQNHGFQSLVNVEDGLQCKKFQNGAQSLARFLALQVKNRGGEIHCSAFVSQVIHNDEGVTVRTRQDKQYKGDYIIIAAPPPALKKINFLPQLSRERRFIIDRYVMGGYTKMVLLYDKHYWRENNHTGAILSDCHDSPVLETYDDTRFKENGQMQPAMVVFIGASIDHEWTTDKELCKKTVIQKLASYFKSVEMLNPIAVEMKVWNEEESIGGAPCAYTPPGVLTKINSVREPEGRIHWAGTETALVSQGYMDGAIESGIRVSKEIVGIFNGEFKAPVKTAPSSKWYSQIMTFKRPGFLSRFKFW